MTISPPKRQGQMRGNQMRHAIQRNPGFARLTFYHVYVACLLGANAVLLMPARSFGQTGSNTLFTLSWIVLAGVTFIFLLTRLNARPLLLLSCVGAAVLLLALSLWSVAPTVTLLYTALLLGNVFTAYLMAVDLTGEQIVQLIGRVILVLCIVGVGLYILSVPQALYYDPHGRPNFLGGQPFRGLFVHKILAGLYASIGAVWAILYLRRMRRILALALFLLVALLAGSTTGLALFTMAAVGAPVIRFCAQRKVPTLPLAFGSVAVASAAIWWLTTNWDWFFTTIGRDPTLTGRTLLWERGVEVALERPWGGWGFFAYFSSEHGEAVREIPVFRNYDIPHFHQAFVQSAVDFGLPFAILLCVAFLFIAVRGYRTAVATGDLDAIFFTTLIFLSIVASFFVHVFVSYNSFVTFALILAFFLMLGGRGRARGPERRSATSGRMW